MNCIKCGREIDEQNVFCPGCLEDMARYPVAPETVVQLPQQQKHHKKAPRKHTPTAEELLKRARNQIGWMYVIMVLIIFMTVVFAFIAFDLQNKYDFSNILGQNYSIVDQFTSTVP